MLYVLSWSAVLFLFAMWSLAAWSVHAMATWTLANANVLSGKTGVAEAMRWPEWLAQWIPSELASAVVSLGGALKPAIDALMAWAPTLAGGLSAAAWVLWAIGAVMLLLLGFALSLLIAVIGRQSSAPQPHRVASTSVR